MRLNPDEGSPARLRGGRTSEEPVSEKGLADVVAAETALSDIDGKLGKLSYVGYDIHDLARYATFEETVFLLHNLRLPGRDEIEALSERLVEERDLDEFTAEL